MKNFLEGVLLLAGQTARSQAYAQALAHETIIPEHTLVFGAPNSGLPGQVAGTAESELAQSAELFLPRMNEPLLETLKTGAFAHQVLSAINVNEPEILETITKLKPRLVIYSGYGSQLVKKPLLALGIPFLHCHSGWVPEFRGSTTLYYSWLKENSCAVSAILLNEKIDKGEIVERKKYPPPPPGIDPDYVYDTAIRADLLVKVLKDWRKNQKLPTMAQTEEGNEYYVIHPVLKHLARLKNADLR